LRYSGSYNGFRFSAAKAEYCFLKEDAVECRPHGLGAEIEKLVKSVLDNHVACKIKPVRTLVFLALEDAFRLGQYPKD
jgi:hypothetical protein